MPSLRRGIPSPRGASRGPLPAGALPELRLQQGTIWNWNRAVYDQHGEGHLATDGRDHGVGEFAVSQAADVVGPEDMVWIAAAVIAGLRLAMKGPIGIAVYPQDTGEAETLLRYARVALREACPQRGETCQFFASGQLERLRHQVWMAAEIEQAYELLKTLMPSVLVFNSDTPREPYLAGDVDTRRMVAAGSTFDALSLGLVVGGAAGLAWPQIVRVLIDAAVAGGQETLNNAVLAMAVIFAVQGGAVALRYYLFSVAAGADYVKTSTGFSSGGATAAERNVVSGNRLRSIWIDEYIDGPADSAELAEKNPGAGPPMPIPTRRPCRRPRWATRRCRAQPPCRRLRPPARARTPRSA